MSRPEENDSGDWLVFDDLWDWLEDLFRGREPRRPELRPERPRPRPIPVPIPPPPPIPRPPIPLPPLPGTILFAYNSSALSPSEVGKLRYLANYLISHPRASIELTGRADPIGSANFNANLGAMRAEVVARQLMTFLVPMSQVRRVQSTGSQDALWSAPRFDRTRALAWRA
jgi:outer membrane protein OmpA-like peptidoglycan-associated protein